MSAGTDARRRWLHRAGAALSALALAWIVWRFAHDLGREPHLAQLLDRALLGRVLAASLLYVLGLGLLVLAWRHLLHALAGRALPARPVAAGYASSQFGKYLPGNVAHYLLRHADLRRLGLSHALLVTAGVLEALSLVLAAAGESALWLGALDWPRLHAALPPLDRARVWLPLLLVGGLLLAALGWALRRNGHGRARLRALLARLPSPARLLPVLLLHAGFFAVMATCLWWLAGALPHPPAWSRVAGAATAAWLGGFLVPGAPGGLGVREVLLAALLHDVVPGGQALLLAVAFRITTFCGDLLLFAAGALAWQRAPAR